MLNGIVARMATCIMFSCHSSTHNEGPAWAPCELMNLICPPYSGLLLLTEDKVRKYFRESSS